MSHSLQVRVTGPLKSFLAGFKAELLCQGYKRTSAANQLRLFAHLSRWLWVKGFTASSLSVAVLDEFLAVRRAQGYTSKCTLKALTPLVDYLRGLGVSILEVKPAPNPSQALLARYQQYLIDSRALVATTAQAYVGRARAFVATRVIHADGELDWTGLGPADINDFVLSSCRGQCVGSAKLVVTGLRSLLGYLHVEGLIREPLVAAVPAVAGWKLGHLPRALDSGALERLVAACDRRTHVGRRDFAMLMLLACLGLRAIEVCRLRLEDIDWRAGEVMVRGKGDRQERLPLPAAVGQAVAAYLQRGRPASTRGRMVFVGTRAPHGALSSTAVSTVVARTARRAGLGQIGAHRLRHTVATQMVRSGVPLPEVSQALRHRHLSTTAIYAKLDRERLRLLARQWPGGAR